MTTYFTSASAIKDGFMTGLSAASVFGSGQVDTNYGVLESTSACCCVVSLAGYENEAMTFGNNRDETWTFFLQVYLKDTGDPLTLKNNVFAATDKVISYLKEDDTIQGTAKGLGRTLASHDPEVAFVVGGFSWLPVEFMVEVQAWDG
jgi:hypothetical protein